MSELGVELRDEKTKQIQQKLKELQDQLLDSGCAISEFKLKKVKSIGSYFICRSLEQLYQLRRHYESGFLKDVLEEIFTVLSSSAERIHIVKVTWTDDNFRQCEKQLREMLRGKFDLGLPCFGLHCFCGVLFVDDI